VISVSMTLLFLIMYFGIGLLSSFSVLLGLGINLKASYAPYPSYRANEIADARENLKVCWGWPYYLLRIFLVAVFGSFFRGLAAVLRGKP
jgi:hypothetical protein